MTHTLSVLLCLKDEGTARNIPRPSQKARNSSLVPLGRRMTLRCQGSLEAYRYHLERKEMSKTETMNVKPSRREGKLHIPSVTEEDAGTYYCLYKHSSVWSERSDPLELVVTGLSSPPLRGHNVTLQYKSEGRYTNYALYKDGQRITQDIAPPHGRGSQANFLIPAVNCTHEGTYQCYTFQSYSPQKCSDPEEGTPLEETLYAAVDDDRQTEETREEDTAAPKSEDPQEVTCAQLNLNSLKAEVEDTLPSGAMETSLNAVLRGAQPEPRGPQDKEDPPHSASAF
ncbi:platelet glycoprotein VI-like [Notamacropus eugenii]|uniref:platelet glycoprotein VI-like n=1 Tax=Notamacropus eugenii TaxID=9315 RepID=UPI003B67EE94